MALPSRTDWAPWASATSPSPRLALAERLRERLIGSIRRECVDHLVVLGEAHLRRILTKYATYYNELRTHRSLNKDAPIRRAIQHEAASYLRPSSAAFITTIAESSFQYTHTPPLPSRSCRSPSPSSGLQRSCCIILLSVPVTDAGATRHNEGRKPTVNRIAGVTGRPWNTKTREVI